MHFVHVPLHPTGFLAAKGLLGVRGYLSSCFGIRSSSYNGLSQIHESNIFGTKCWSMPGGKGVRTGKGGRIWRAPLPPPTPVSNSLQPVLPPALELRAQADLHCSVSLVFPLACQLPDLLQRTLPCFGQVKCPFCLHRTWIKLGRRKNKLIIMCL